MNTDETLDPPGSIVIVGTTALGLEAAIYGRYLGYDIQVIAGVDAWLERDFLTAPLQRLGPLFQDDWYARHWLLGRSLQEAWEDPLPMMPTQCLSPLSNNALDAQSGDPMRMLPCTMQEWIEGALGQLIQTDLLRGRVDTHALITEILQVPVELDDETDAATDEVPPDFLLNLRNDQPPIQAEAVIVADVPLEEITIRFDRPASYFFELKVDPDHKPDEQLRAGWQQITKIYAGLAGRESLDLYRPQRM